MEGKSERLAQMTGDDIKLTVHNAKGWNVKFDKTPATVSTLHYRNKKCDIVTSLTNIFTDKKEGPEHSISIQQAPRLSSEVFYLCTPNWQGHQL